ncbi:hypothetical protein JCM10212_004008 [Sporobolomyces blumeae]
MADVSSPPRPSLTVSILSLARVHTALSALAFSAALALGLHGHYHRIVKNQWYAYPDEFVPSVSATIGDWFPERNLFQLLIALTSGPRLLLVLLSYVAQSSDRPSSYGPATLAVVSVLRTLSCGGWVFVTSSDSGDTHDVFMVLYIVLNLPYMALHTLYSDPRSKRLRRTLAIAFFATLAPLVYFYIQHKVHRIAGAYSIYALFEWSLIILDVSFDAVFIADHGDPTVPPVSLEFTSAPPRLDDAPRTRPPSRITTAIASWTRSTASTRSFLADVYLSYLFWTLLTALGPMIFFNSVWAMGLSGDEVLLFIILSPGLLALPALRTLFAHPFFAHVGLVVGVVARWIPDEADHAKGHGLRRLRTLSAGLGLATMGRTTAWWRARRDEAVIRVESTTFLVGLVGSLVAKYANHSINPVWPFVRATVDEKTNNGGSNATGLCLGVLALVEACTRSRSPTSSVAAPSVPRTAESDKKSDDPVPLDERGPFGSYLASTLGFGGLWFLVVLLFTDTGTTIAYSFAGYPTSGPFNVPHGWLTIAALSLGISFNVANPSLAARIAYSPVTFVVASACAALTYSQTSWASYLPALVLATYTTLLFPHSLASVLTHSTRPSAFFVSFLTYCVLVLASTFCVAYAFVPGGNAFRERMDAVLAVTMLLIGVGLYPTTTVSVAGRRRRSSAASSSSRPVLVSRSFRRLATTSCLVLVLASAAIAVWRHQILWSTAARPNDPENRVISAAIWTVHFGLDGKMWESQRRMAQIVRDAEIDVIGLLESDVHRIVGGNRDITQYMSETLGMPYVDLGPSPHKNTWGCALVSKFPIVRSSHHLLPSPAGELAPAIYATLDVYGIEVDVVVSHNGQEEDPLDRELQSAELGRLMRERWPNPAIFLGYVVTHPHAERPAPYKLLVEDGRMFDVDPTVSDRWCQYILYRSLHRIGFARLNRGSKPSITDTEIQVAKFVVPYRNAPGSPWSVRRDERGGVKLELPLTADQEDALISSSSEVDDDDAKARLEVEPVPIDQIPSHLRLTRAPVPVARSVPDDVDVDRRSYLDSTVAVPSRHVPRSLRFPDRLSSASPSGLRGHYFISLEPHDDDDRRRLRDENVAGAGAGPRYYLERSVAERRDKEERARAQDECKTM